MMAEKRIIISTDAINFLAKNYNPLNYFVQLSSLLKAAFPLQNFDDCSKYQLHKIFNDALIQNYNGEEIHKYNLFAQHIKKRNIVGAFEMNVNSSRVDFLTINGSSTSYEIKSELDNLSKLNKQMGDYMLVFEYNYLVTDERHVERALAMLPNSFGLWSYKNGKYKKLKKAELNDKIDAEIQLKLLSKKELITIFPRERGELISILATYSSVQINERFKNILKERYRSRWSFLLSNVNNILPIDIQFFFNTNIQPHVIYYH